MASDRAAIIAQALADVDIQIGVARESIEIQISNMQAKHGLNWTKEWRRYRLSITKRLYNLFERRHVLTLLRDFPERAFFGQTEIVGVINAKGKMIKRFKGWKHFRIADWSEWAGTDSRPIAQLGDVKTSKAITDSVKQLKTGKVKGSFRPGSTVKDQLNKERYVIRKAKALGGRLLLRVQDVLTLKYHTRIIDPKDLRPGAFVPYGHNPDFLLPRPITRPPKLPTSQTGKPTARGKQKATNPAQPATYVGGTPDNAKAPKGKKTRGKGKGKLPLEPTTYIPGRGTDSATPTAKDRGTDTSTKPKQKSAEIVTVNSKGSTFRMNLSARYPKTIASLKFGGALVFNMILGSIVTRFREKIVREIHGNALAKIFEEERTQIAIENKLTELAHLSERDDKAYYIQVQLSEHWWGRFNRDGSSEGSLETPVWFRLHGISGPIENGNRACKVTSIEQRDDEPDGVEHKFQICAYPLLINPAYKMKLERDKVAAKVAQAHRDKIQRWDTCIGSELGKIKSAGPITPQEQEVAETICTKRWGRRPLTRD